MKVFEVTSEYEENGKTIVRTEYMTHSDNDIVALTIAIEELFTGYGNDELKGVKEVLTVSRRFVEGKS